MLTDKEGLDIAYKRNDGIYRVNDKIYIAGTKSIRDVYDDVYNLPFNRVTQRYRDLDKIIRESPHIRKLVGHSLGAYVARYANNRYNNLDLTLYGDPKLNFNNKSNITQYRNKGDPISMFDQSSNSSEGCGIFHPFLNHSYDNIANKKILYTPPTNKIIYG